MTTKRAIIYTRFSPRRNAEKCDSCETQAAFCEQYAATHGLTVIAQYHDKDVSGADEYREKLWQAIKALAKGDTLLVYKRDRLARNVYLAEKIGMAVEARGASITAVAGDVEGNGIEHTMIRQILAAIAEYERGLIRQRTTHYMREHQRNGRRMARYAPYGWRIDDADARRMLPVPAEQTAIKQMIDLRAKGFSLGEIVKKLDPEVARSGKWNTKTVWKVLRRQ